MTRPEALPEAPSEAEEQSVLDFLAKTPDFFERHAEVLENMPISHGSGTAVSLIERQVQVLRTRNQQLEARLESLLETARQNEARVQGMNALAEALIRADSPAAVISAIGEVLAAEFAVDSIKMALFEIPEHCEDLGLVPLAAEHQSGAIRDFFRTGQTQCGPLDEELKELLFAGHSELRSAALVPLDQRNSLGLIALASVDENRFTPTMGRLFLDMTANLATAALRFHSREQAGD